MNVYAVLTTMTALLVAAAVLAGSLVYRARQRRTGRLGRLEDAVIGRQIDDLAAGTMAPTEATQLLRELRYLPAPGSKDPNANLSGALSFPDNEHGTSRLGYRLFKWLLLLGFFLIAGLMGYAWWTYPTTADATAYLPLGATLADRLAAVQELRRDWLQQVKDLGQVFVLTPVFPLLGTVVGYLFGVRRSAKERPEPPEPVPVEPSLEKSEEKPVDAAATLESSEQLTDLAEANAAVSVERPAEKPARRAPTKVPASGGPAQEVAGLPSTIVRTDDAGTAPKRAPRRSPRRSDPA